MSWQEVAEWCQEVFGSFIDWEDRFFICPYCEEPLYECDWDEESWRNSDEWPHGFCPVCETSFDDESVMLFNEEDEDEEDYDYDDEF